MIEYIILRYVIWKKFFTAWKIGQIILHQWIWVSYIIHRAWHCYTKIFFSTILVQTWKIHANFFVAYFEYLIFCKTTLGNSHKSIWIYIWSLTHFCLLSIILIQMKKQRCKITVIFFVEKISRNTFNCKYKLTDVFDIHVSVSDTKNAIIYFFCKSDICSFDPDFEIESLRQSDSMKYFCSLEMNHTWAKGGVRGGRGMYPG